MKLKPDQERVKTLISDTLTLLCKNGLNYDSEFCVEALIGITLDKDQVFLVNIKETITKDAKRNNSSAKVRKRKPSDEKRPVVGVPNGTHSELEYSATIKSRKLDVRETLVSETPVSSSVLPKKQLFRSGDARTPECQSPNTFQTQNEVVDLSEISSEAEVHDLSVRDNHIVIKPETIEDPTQLVSDSLQGPQSGAEGSENIPPLEGIGSGPPVWPEPSVTFTPASSVPNSIASPSGVDSPAQPQDYRNKRKKFIPVKLENEKSGTKHQRSLDVAAPVDPPTFGSLPTVLPHVPQIDIPEPRVNVTPLRTIDPMPEPHLNTEFPDYSNSVNSNTLVFSSSFSPTFVKREEYQCNTCSKTFRSKEGWKIHMERHEGKSRYQCPHCNRGFMAQTHLKAHISEHTNELPWPCETCGQKFKYLFTLKKHRTDFHQQ